MKSKPTLKRQLTRRLLDRLVRLLERLSLLIQGWRPRRLNGRGDGKLWFWQNPANGHLLEREIAYDVAARGFRRKEPNAPHHHQPKTSA